MADVFLGDEGAARPLVVQTEHLDAAAAAWLSERAELVACSSRDVRFEGLLGRAAGLVIRTYTTVDSAFLDRAPLLRVVGRAGVGLDNVDLAQCARRGVAVVHTPGANRQAVVEYVLTMLLDVLRPRVTLDRELPVEQWISLRRSLAGERELGELTVGVYGFGRIGMSVGRAMAAIGARVIYHDLLAIPEERRRWGESVATPVSRDELLRQSDVVTLHVDGRPSNRGLIDARALSLMRPDAVFINAARGMLAPADALAAWLAANPRATAIIDVHDPEPIARENPLLGLPGARLTPHIAGATAAADRAMSWVVRDVWRVLSGERPECPALEA